MTTKLYSILICDGCGKIQEIEDAVTGAYLLERSEGGVRAKDEYGLSELYFCSEGCNGKWELLQEKRRELEKEYAAKRAEAEQRLGQFLKDHNSMPIEEFKKIWESRPLDF